MNLNIILKFLRLYEHYRSQRLNNNQIEIQKCFVLAWSRLLEFIWSFQACAVRDQSVSALKIPDHSFYSNLDSGVSSATSFQNSSLVFMSPRNCRNSNFFFWRSLFSEYSKLFIISLISIILLKIKLGEHLPEILSTNEISWDVPLVQYRLVCLFLLLSFFQTFWFFYFLTIEFGQSR